jgi:adenine-specific DNA-methyltransferase
MTGALMEKSQMESQATKQSETLPRFQELLKELFEFECADLDFGIYRIMNHKREIIKDFIENKLPNIIEKELSQGALAEQTRAHKARHASSDEDLETAIYNHLYTFFSRYWQDGDFISKRRYSKRECYAIPYNGEEVYLYWANHDQYYIKTAEHFTDYSYKAPNGVTVHFKLRQADVELNNVKGEKRFFLPQVDAIEWDAQTRTLTIPFEYRPLTPEEQKRYGEKNQQKTIIDIAVNEIPKRVQAACDPESLTALTTERRMTDEGISVSYLEHHLRRYTRRNTSDFFIHKDLKGFLSRELDFYLKNEVLNLDEMERAGEDLAERWFQRLRIIKRIGMEIIEFLAQIENFQKMLWEKKKFVTETFYCITVGNIPKDFYREIAQCEAQWEEWKTLYHIHEEFDGLLTADLETSEGRIEFLKAHPTLVLDTRHFSPDFTDRLLACFENLDDAIDGLLVHSENWQALNLLQERYRGRVKCIYIDPPYNTGSDEFIYKDSYRHSSWLSMMMDRLSKAYTIIGSDGSFWINIDENEVANLSCMAKSVFGDDFFAGSICWKKTTGDNDTIFSFVHDNLLVFAKDKDKSLRTAPYGKKQLSRYSNPDNDPRGLWMPSDYRCKYTKEQRPNLYYPIVHPKTGVEIYPDTYSSTRRVWAFSKQQHEENVKQNRIWWGNNQEHTEPKLKRFLSESKGMNIRSIWLEEGTNDSASKMINDILHSKNQSRSFKNPKPVQLIKKVIHHSMTGMDTILDFFAGSGTTGHAVINLNRDDGGRRKFILVEMAEYFDTVLLPRLKKVIFTPEWKEGKPKRMATDEEAKRSPRILKIIRLESYEDALNNLTFDEASGQTMLDRFGDEYLLRYMLVWETRRSETLLNVEKLAAPFCYKLKIHRDGETQERTVDLPETFNYLLGLEVQKRLVHHENGRRYLIYRGALPKGRTAVVIWRDIQGWTDKDFQHEATIVANQKWTHDADEVYVNGDSSIPNAQSLDDIFKRRLFAPVEA